MRTLLVTGASSDIGQRLILDRQNIFQRIVAQCSKAPERLEALREAVGKKLTIVQADFTNEADTLRMLAELKAAELFPSDIVHLPAGSFELKKFTKTTWSDFQEHLNISLRSLVLILYDFLPVMAKRQDGRIIIMLSAVTGNIPPKYLSHYVSTKYALLGLVKALAIEYAEKGISVNGISPEMTDTHYLNTIPPLVKELNIKNSPRGRMLMPEDILPIFRLLLDRDSRAITGQNFLITDGK